MPHAALHPPPLTFIITYITILRKQTPPSPVPSACRSSSTPPDVIAQLFKVMEELDDLKNKTTLNTERISRLEALQRERDQLEKTLIKEMKQPAPCTAAFATPPRLMPIPSGDGKLLPSCAFRPLGASFFTQQLKPHTVPTASHPRSHGGNA